MRARRYLRYPADLTFALAFNHRLERLERGREGGREGAQDESIVLKPLINIYLFTQEVTRM